VFVIRKQTLKQNTAYIIINTKIEKHEAKQIQKANEFNLNEQSAAFQLGCKCVSSSPECPLKQKINHYFCTRKSDTS